MLANPSAAPVLERHHLDYCCGGRRSLSEACAEAGIDHVLVLSELSDTAPGAPSAWADLDPPALAQHIVATHHHYLHTELPLLDALADKVLAAHGRRHPELAEVRRLVAATRAELEPHLLKEERVLFPAIEALATGRRDFGFGTVANPIRMMEREHDRAGDLLAELRAVTSGFEVPADAVRATGRCTRVSRSSRPTPTSTSTRRTTCCSQRRSRFRVRTGAATTAGRGSLPAG